MNPPVSRKTRQSNEVVRGDKAVYRIRLFARLVLNPLEDSNKSTSLRRSAWGEGTSLKEILERPGLKGAGERAGWADPAPGIRG